MAYLIGQGRDGLLLRYAILYYRGGSECALILDGFHVLCLGADNVLWVKPSRYAYHDTYPLCALHLAVSSLRGPLEALEGSGGRAHIDPSQLFLDAKLDKISSDVQG